MVVQKEDELDIYLGLRGYGNLDLKGTYMYDLVGFKVSRPCSE